MKNPDSWRGVTIDEERIPTVAPEVADAAPELSYLNPELPRFHLLDKVLPLLRASSESPTH